VSGGDGTDDGAVAGTDTGNGDSTGAGARGEGNGGGGGGGSGGGSGALIHFSSFGDRPLTAAAAEIDTLNTAFLPTSAAEA
jgi:hypothetical protein